MKFAVGQPHESRHILPIGEGLYNWKYNFVICINFKHFIMLHSNLVHIFCNMAQSMVVLDNQANEQKFFLKKVNNTPGRLHISS